MTERPSLRRRLFGEFLGSALLAAVVVGSGIAAQQLSPHDIGLELLENAAAIAAGIYAIILMLRPVSGAHMNPVVSVVDAVLGGIAWRDVCGYIAAQVIGFSAGAIAANGMFAKAAVSISHHHRASPAHLWAEVIATAGLVLVIFALARAEQAVAAPAAVAGYIFAACFFTSSACFVNPALSIGRMFSNSFTGISPASVPGFIVAEVLGGALGLAVVRLLYPDGPKASA